MDSTRAGNNNAGNKNGNINGNTNQGSANGNVNGNNNKGSDNGNVNGNVNLGTQNGNFNGNGNKGSNNGNGSGNGNKGNVNGSNNANRNKGSGNGNSKYVCAAEALTPFARKPFFIRRFCRPDRGRLGGSLRGFVRQRRLWPQPTLAVAAKHNDCGGGCGSCDGGGWRTCLTTTLAAATRCLTHTPLLGQRNHMSSPVAPVGLV